MCEKLTENPIITANLLIEPRVRVNDVLTPLAIVITEFSVRFDIMLGYKDEDWFVVDVHELTFDVAVLRVIQESSVTTILGCSVNTDKYHPIIRAYFTVID